MKYSTIKKGTTGITLALAFLFSISSVSAQVNLSNGLVAYFPLDNNHLDYSGNANNGIAAGGTGFIADRLGNPNSAASFGGTANPGKITIVPSASLTFATGVTFAFWARVSSATGTFGNGSQGAGGSQCLFAKGGDAGGGLWQISRFTTNTLTNEIGNNATPTLTGALTPYALNEWFHYVVTMDANGHNIYVNGVLQSSNTNAANLAAMTTRNLVLGRFNSNWYALNGAIDEFRVYNRVINNSEILALMEDELATIDITLVGPTSICAGQNVTVNYSSTGDFASGNIFNLQLSDVEGSFTNPTHITQLTSSNNTGSITMTVPDITATGAGYRFRIVSTAPNAISDTTAAISVTGVLQSIPSPALYNYVGSIGGNHYYLSTNQLTWHQAQAQAQANGGHLATIPNAQVNTLLDNSLSTGIAYIGLTDEITEGTFLWVDGSPITYTNWNPGEPNNVGAGEDFGVITTNGTWFDGNGVTPGFSYLQLSAAGIDQNLCSNATIQLNGGLLSGATYSWTGPNGFTSAVQNPTLLNASGLNSGTYSLTITNLGCSVSDNVNIVVNQTPANIGQNSSLLTSLSSGLVVHYPMNGNAVDVSGGGNNGTLVGGVIASTNRFGEPNSSLQFNGTNGHITVPAGVYFNGSDFTVSAWVRKVTNNNWSRLFDFGNGQANENVLLAISNGTTGRPASQVYIGTTPGPLVSSPTVMITNNKWELLTYTWSNGNGVLYIDGIQRAQGSQSTPNNIVRAINYIGRANWASDGYANARFDDFRIYNRMLNSSEIQSLVLEQPNALSASVISGTICFGTSAQIALAYTQPGVTYQMRNAATSTNVGAAQLGTGDTLYFATGVLTTSTAFNFTANVASGCNTILTPNITVNVQAIPVAPVATNDTVCNSGIMTISVFGGVTYNWYIAPTGGVPLTTITGNSHTTSAINVTENYFVSAIDAFGCESARTPISAVVYNPLNPPVDIISGLILNYKFQNNLADSSGNGYNASVFGTNSYVNDRNGNASSAIYSTAVGDPGNNYISAGNPVKVQQLTNQVTISMWIKQEQTWFGDGGQMPLVSKWNLSTGLYVGLRMQNPSNMSNRVRWRVNGAVFVESNTNVPINQWHHIVCTFNGAQLRIYQNGVLTGSLNHTGSIGNTVQNLLLGRDATGTALEGITYRGDWDEVKIYNRALNQSEISTLFNNESVAFATSPLCDGEGDLALTTFSFPGATYNWTGPNGFSSTLQNPSVIVNADSTTYAGTYTLQVTNQGCTSPNQTVEAVIYQIPSAPTSINDTVCGSGNAVLTASGAPSDASYRWYTVAVGGTAIVGETSATLTINNLTVTTDRFVSIIRNGCEGDRSPVTAVYLNNVITNLTVTGSSVCNGVGTTTVTINNSEAGISYRPFFAGNPVGNSVIGNGTSLALTVNTSGMLIGANSVTIQATQFSCGPINLTNTATITLFANPVASITANGSLNFCQGGNVQLTATTASSYLWSNGATTPSITVATTGSFSVIITDANGCSGTSSVVNTVENTSPVPIISSGGSTTICDGSNVLLNASGGSSYLWGTGETSSSIVVTQAGTYNFTAFNGTCSSLSSDITVTVNPAPTVIINASQSTICIGESVTLTGAGAVSYSWNNGVTNGVSFAPSTTQTYTVTGNGANGCQNTALIQVVVNQLPNVDAGTAQSICIGNATTLNGAGAQSYVWNNGVTNGVAFTPGTTDTYTVTGTDANGCQNTDQIVVTVNALPIVEAGLNQTICAGESVILSGSGADSYSWNLGVVDGVAFIPSGTATYTVTGLSGGCQATDEVTITLNTLPIIGAITTESEVCAGESVTLTGSGAVSYSWNNGVTNGVSFAPSTTQTYTVTGNDANGCQNTALIQVVVKQLPNVDAGTAQSICMGDEVTLNGAGAQSYIWNNSVTNGVAFTPGTSDTYTVTGTDMNGCQNTDQIVVTVNALPNVAVTQNSLTLTAVESNASYQWMNCLTETIIIGETNQSFTATFNGDYAVIIESMAGCTDTSNCASINTVGLENTSAADYVKLYPNPVTSFITLEVSDVRIEELHVYDTSGKLIVERSLDKIYTTINVERLEPGMYFYKLINTQGVIVHGDKFNVIR